MHIILSKYGSSIRKSGEMLEISREGEKQRISPKKVSSILITTGAVISTDVVEMCLQNNIDLIFLDKYGSPLGRFWHARMGSTARIRRAQLHLSMEEEGLRFGLRWIDIKLKNQIEFLQGMQKRRSSRHTDIGESIDNLKKQKKSLQSLHGTMQQQRHTILGFEGNAGKEWWKIYASLLPVTYQFSGRSRQPAKDEANALLNYGYGVLYGLVEKAVILAGMDPYIGFVHTDHYNKISFVFDVIEAYRIWVDEAVMSLFSGRMVTKDLFTRLANGVILNDEGKKIFLPHLFEYFDQVKQYKHRNLSQRDTMQLEMHALAQEFLQYGESQAGPEEEYIETE